MGILFGVFLAGAVPLVVLLARSGQPDANTRYAQEQELKALGVVSPDFSFGESDDQRGWLWYVIVSSIIVLAGTGFLGGVAALV